MLEEIKDNKSPIAKREEEILTFWRDNKIFEKSLEKPTPKGEYVFYDGPPFATGLPHYGSLLSSIVKDVIPRYKTMRGFKVRRRWGWDCHGLPIESMVEKKLGLKTKKDIEDVGVAKFNETARGIVLEYANDWEKYIERIGRWVEFKNSYKTMDNAYIESVWWALSQIHKRGLLYEGRKVLMYCPHCETPLAKAEIAMDNSYKDVMEEAVTVKFKLKGEKNTYILAWTTTPWTLPANVALAVGEKISYVKVKIEEEILILAKDRVPIVLKNRNYEILEELTGKKLIALQFEPLFDVPKIKESDNAYKVYAGDFVNLEEGTGIVHTAVMYGEDDFILGQRENLPMVPLLDASGKYNDNAPEFLRGRYIKKAEKEIMEHLEKSNLLFEKSLNTHSYPHCYRCGTPLIYNAITSWFINIQKVKKEIQKNNEKINWFPEHLKYGRFGNIIENAPDWTISRNRYWASPLPIWKNQKTGEVTILGSVEEMFLKNKSKQMTRLILLRHGESEKNILDIADISLGKYGLTKQGEKEAKNTAKILKKINVSSIYSSPIRRAKETALILGNSLSVEVFFDERLFEVRSGEWDGHPWDSSVIYKNRVAYNKLPNEEYYTAKRGENGESWEEVQKRMTDFIREIIEKHKGQTVVIVSHEGPLMYLLRYLKDLSLEEITHLWDESRFFHRGFLGSYAEPTTIFVNNKTQKEIDLHKPYIDEIELFDEDGSPLKRVPEVLDCWFESGSMPFAEWHYPFENKKEFEKRFPGDFIAEYIAQTRTWFYYTHVLGTILFGSPAYKNVVTTGTILASDGSKISKSKGNYTDVLQNINKYSADALRFYLMGSVVMQAEDLNFRDEELREAQNKVINLLWNSFKFYELYKSDVLHPHIASENILDKWIKSRLSQVIDEVTKAMEKYDMVKATRPIPKFIDDFSTWYIRRSRDRFKNDENVEDKNEAIFTTRKILLEFSKTIAPLIPFMAEIIYLGVKGKDDPESVHLCEFPKPGKIDEKIIRNMETARQVASEALEARAREGIKVRQPLGKLSLKDENLKHLEYLLKIIKDEVNVEIIVFDSSQKENVLLDIDITPELLRKGMHRDFIRQIQDLRKKSSLKPSQKIIVSVKTNDEGERFLEDFDEEIFRVTKVKINFVEILKGENIEIGKLKFEIMVNQ